MDSVLLKIYQNRKLVSDLIMQVLVSEISVQDALASFPDDKNDINIKCAFDALVHREADEDYRKKVKGYKEIQDEFLETIANILKENQKLPKNIIEKYYKFHKDDIIYKKQDTFLKDILQNLKRKLFY